MKLVRGGLIFSLAVTLLTCAPRMQPLTVELEHGTTDEEAEANREALHILAGRAENAATESRELPLLPVTVVEPPPTSAELGEGSIERDELVVYHEGGPHQLLTTVGVEPILTGSEFVGYRIAHISETAGPVLGCGLREGDVVTAVNGTDIGRPEGFMVVWDSLPSTEHLNVDIIRDGEARTLSWLVE